jgi:hypothetical protein
MDFLRVFTSSMHELLGDIVEFLLLRGMYDKVSPSLLTSTHSPR